MPPIAVIERCSVEKANHRVLGIFVELRALGPFEADHGATVLDHGTLHSEADSEEGDAPFARPTDRLHLAFDAPFAETARHEQTVVARQQPLRALRFNIFAADAANANLCFVGHSRMVDRFVN